MKYSPLPKSYKGRFPFRLCTTSFIYPDLYAPNVEMLAPYLDEIELLFFESGYEGALPSSKDMEEIGKLLDESETSCNVHLPLDISLGDKDRAKRIKAVETVERVVDLANPLSPSTYTVHFTYEEKDRSDPAIAAWKDRLRDSFDRIVKKTPMESFTVENLVDYPFEWMDAFLEETGLRVCMDIGHYIERGENFAEAYCRRHQKIDILHVYGVRPEKDHQSLKHIDTKWQEELIEILSNFLGVVSVEVFSFDNLKKSLDVLESWGSRAGW